MIYGWRRLFRGLRPAIVMYHRVGTASCDPWGLMVTPANFTSQIDMFVRERITLPLDAFISAAAGGSLPANAIAVTFDDGYLDNLTLAAPILKVAGVPATLFLATGPMLNGCRYWWDELAGVVFDPEPWRGELTIGSWLETILLDRVDPADAIDSEWRAWHAPQTQRQALYYRLWDKIRVLSPAAIAAVMAELRATRGERQEQDVRPMAAAEVQTLLSETTFTLGAHTVDHPDLPSLPDDEVIAQLMQGKQQVSTMSGQVVTGFAYPYGRWNATTRRLVEASGFEWACTTRGGYVGRHCDPLALPRLTAPDRPDISWVDHAPRGWRPRWFPASFGGNA